LLDKELSVTLLMEFNLRFDKQGSELKKLWEKLAEYDNKINLISQTQESNELKNELPVLNKELNEEISNLLIEIE